MREKLRRLAMIVLAVILLVSGAMVFDRRQADRQAREEYDRLAQIASRTAQESTSAAAETEPAGTEPAGTPAGPSAALPIAFEALQKVNPDIKGWIRIEGTQINYPIVQAKDNDFYLNHNFNGEKSASGAIFLDFESRGDFDGRNNILYGHNMKNGTMFKDVVKYKDETFFKEHPYFTIYTPRREIRLKAVAAYYGEARPIVRKTRFASQQSFDAFVQEMVSPCKYAQEVRYPARTLYTLVTCSYEMEDARTFLFAVEVAADGSQLLPDAEFQQRMKELPRQRTEKQRIDVTND